jgi:hypothetical protein
MQEDKFKDWLQDNLEEELRTVRFSPEAKARVQAQVSVQAPAAVNPAVQAPAGSFPTAGKNLSWWNKRISLPWTVLAAGIILLLALTGFYAGSLFYVTPREIAAYKADQEIVLPTGNTPFGAMQMATLHLPDKGGETP